MVLTRTMVNDSDKGHWMKVNYSYRQRWQENWQCFQWNSGHDQPKKKELRRVRRRRPNSGAKCKTTVRLFTYPNLALSLLRESIAIGYIQNQICFLRQKSHVFISWVTVSKDLFFNLQMFDWKKAAPPERTWYLVYAAMIYFILKTWKLVNFNFDIRSVTTEGKFNSPILDIPLLGSDCLLRALDSRDPGLKP